MDRFLNIFARALLVLILLVTPVLAAEQRVIATVYDKPVTSRDVDYLIALNKFLGRPAVSRKVATEEVINQMVLVETARTERYPVTQKELDERLLGVSKALKTDRNGLSKKLKAQGISMRTMEQFLSSQIALNRIIRFKYKAQYKPDPSAVDRKVEEVRRKVKSQVDQQYNKAVAEVTGKLEKIKNDPRRKPVTVFTILEVIFPVDTSGPDAAQLLQSRAVEANVYASKFKSCKNPKGPAEGIFNVKIGRRIDADASKLPPELRKLLASGGPNKAYGPMRAQSGLQLVAFCGQRTVKPPPLPKVNIPPVKYPEIPREAIAQQVEAEQFEAFAAKYIVEIRKNAIVEYKDAQGSQ